MKYCMTLSDDNKIYQKGNVKCRGINLWKYVAHHKSKYDVPFQIDWDSYV